VKLISAHSMGDETQEPSKQRSGLFAMSGQEGCATSLHCATLVVHLPSPHRTGLVGGQASPTGQVELVIMPEGSMHEAIAPRPGQACPAAGGHGQSGRQKDGDETQLWSAHL